MISLTNELILWVAGCEKLKQHKGSITNSTVAEQKQKKQLPQI